MKEIQSEKKERGKGREKRKTEEMEQVGRGWDDRWGGGGDGFLRRPRREVGAEEEYPR